MVVNRKLDMILTIYFICINQEYYVIYLQNMKFVWFIFWPGGVYTDNTYTTKPESWSHIRIHFMNHDYIGSFWQCQMSQKVGEMWKSRRLDTLELGLCGIPQWGGNANITPSFHPNHTLHLTGPNSGLAPFRILYITKQLETAPWVNGAVSYLIYNCPVAN